jgi:hypothetical protein
MAKENKCLKNVDEKKILEFLFCARRNHFAGGSINT